jgi:hypothetical protein
MTGKTTFNSPGTGASSTPRAAEAGVSSYLPSGKDLTFLYVLVIWRVYFYTPIDATKELRVLAAAL